VANQRIKGQECSVIITRDQIVEAELTDIQSFNWEHVAETIVEGYLGETNDRTDDVFKHAKGDLELHIHDAASIRAFMKAVKDRQTRRSPDLQINLSLLEQYPDGQTRVISFPNIKFGGIPVNVPARAQYVKLKLDWVSDNYDDTDS
jgi:hypothetical protein